MILSDSQLSSVKRAWGKALRAPLTLAGAAAGIALLVAGCSGSNGSNHAVVRATNAIAEEGDMSMIINAGAVNGTQSYGETSGYLYFPSTGQSTAAFALSKISSGTAFPSVPLTFNVTGANAYTLVAYGDPTQAATSVLYPNILLLTDNSNPVPSGEALIRVANVAPAAGVINYSFGSSTSTPVLYGGATLYGEVPVGANTLTVTSATTGAVLFTQSIPVSAGKAYTVLVSESMVAATVGSTVTGTTEYGPIILNDR